VTRFALLFLIAPALGGCVASMAVSALGMAAQGARGRPVSNEALRPQALKACSAHAAHFGAVTVIDVEQHRVDKIIVWGTIDDGTGKVSFQCDFGTRITEFTFRPIKAQP
jgi:hypothetical protein